MRSQSIVRRKCPALQATCCAALIIGLALGFGCTSEQTGLDSSADTQEVVLSPPDQVEKCAIQCPSNSTCSGENCFAIQCSGPSLEDPIWGYVMYFNGAGDSCKLPGNFDGYGYFQDPRGTSRIVQVSPMLLTNALIPILAHKRGGSDRRVAIVEAVMGAHEDLSEECGWEDSPDGNWHIMVDSMSSMEGDNCLNNAKVILGRASSSDYYDRGTPDSRRDFEPLAFELRMSTCEDRWLMEANMISVDGLMISPQWILNLKVDFEESPKLWPDEIEVEVCGVIDVAGTKKIHPGHHFKYDDLTLMFDGSFILKKRKFTAILNGCFNRELFVGIESCSNINEHDSK